MEASRNGLPVGGLFNVTTWASRPSASAVAAGTIIRVSDVGQSPGVLMESDGSVWRPLGGEATLFRATVPVGLAPTFTGTSNGAITLGTALDTTYPGLYLYFPANSLSASHPAGFYWVVMSSTTAGTAYNNAYDPATESAPAIPASLTPFSGAVPGGAGINAKTTVLQKTIKGGLLGDFGGIRAAARMEYTNGANNKAMRLEYGGNIMLTTGNVTTTARHSAVGEFYNAGVNNRQKSLASWAPGTSGTGGAYMTVDTSVDTVLALTLQPGATTDWTICNGLNLRFVV